MTLSLIAITCPPPLLLSPSPMSLLTVLITVAITLFVDLASLAHNSCCSCAVARGLRGGPSVSGAQSNSRPLLLALPLSLLPLPLPSLLPVRLARRGRSNNVWAFNAQKTVCAKGVGLLLVFVEWVLSPPPNDNSNVGRSTIVKSSLMHLMGMGRVNLANYSTCLHRLIRMMALPAHLGSRDNNDCNGGRLEWSGEGPVHCLTCNLRCWYACSKDGQWGGPR
jgi:hypothetical protein